MAQQAQSGGAGGDLADECGFTEQPCERRPASALELLLRPTSTEFIAVDASEKPEPYLDKCHQNLRAEIWMLYSGKVNPSFPRWRDALEHAFVDKSSSGDKVTAAYRDASRSQPWKLKELSWNLVVLGDRLCLLQPISASGSLWILQGAEIRVDDNAPSDDLMHVVGYVQPYKRALEAIQELRKGGLNNGLLRDVASPRGREAGFWGDGAETCFYPKVPSNAPQRAIVQGLSASVECIQGPPGTGKSTTIFHILSARLRPECRALVTCVQNKAVDSIVEKLAQSIDRLPFFVHGDSATLGDCAVRFTAPAQAARDPEVVRLGALLRDARNDWERIQVLRAAAAVCNASCPRCCSAASNDSPCLQSCVCCSERLM